MEKVTKTFFCQCCNCKAATKVLYNRHITTKKHETNYETKVTLNESTEQIKEKYETMIEEPKEQYENKVKMVLLGGSDVFSCTSGNLGYFWGVSIFFVYFWGTNKKSYTYGWFIQIIFFQNRVLLVLSQKRVVMAGLNMRSYF